MRRSGEIHRIYAVVGRRGKRLHHGGDVCGIVVLGSKGFSLHYFYCRNPMGQEFFVTAGTRIGLAVNWGRAAAAAPATKVTVAVASIIISATLSAGAAMAMTATAFFFAATFSWLLPRLLSPLPPLLVDCCLCPSVTKSLQFLSLSTSSHHRF
jgi:hypothetical protein